MPLPCPQAAQPMREELAGFEPGRQPFRLARQRAISLFFFLFLSTLKFSGNAREDETRVYNVNLYLSRDCLPQQYSQRISFVFNFQIDSITTTCIMLVQSQIFDVKTILIKNLYLFLAYTRHSMYSFRSMMMYCHEMMVVDQV